MGALPWFKLYPDAWVRKTRTLSLEARAVYFDCLCLIYQTDGPINHDDKWMAHYLHVSPRLWRTVRDELVAGGFLIETDTGLSDRRAEEEIENRAKVRRNNSEIATNRERKRRENPEKFKENNETEARNEHHIERIEERDRKEESQLASKTEQEPARATSEARLAGDFFEELVSDVLAWVPTMGDPNARTWVGNTVRDFGSDLVREAHRKLKTDIASGRAVSRKLQMFDAILVRLKREADAKAAEAAKPKPQLVYAYHPEDDEYRVFKGEKPLKENWRELLAELEAKKTA